MENWIEKSIDESLSPYKNTKLTRKDLQEALHTIDEKCLALITIKNGSIKLEHKPERTMFLLDRSMRLQLALFQMLKHADVKKKINTSFLIDYEDHLKENSEVPIFGYCKQKGLPGVLIPDETEDESYRRASFISQICPWDRKISRAYFRGATSGNQFTTENLMQSPRMQLVEMGHENPKVLDAKFTKVYTGQFTEGKALAYFYIKFNLAPYEDEGNVVRYRYGIDADGNTNAWTRCRYILSTNSLCIKHKTPFIQWFYSTLKPGEHYLEVERDFSDLIEKIEWAENNEKACQKMIENSSRLASQIFTKEAQRDYLYQTLLKYQTKFENI